VVDEFLNVSWNGHATKSAISAVMSFDTKIRACIIIGMRGKSHHHRQTRGSIDVEIHCTEMGNELSCCSVTNVRNVAFMMKADYVCISRLNN